MNIQLTFLTVLCCTATMVQAETVKIYAAASLTNAITDIAKQFQAQNPETKIVTVFGASSALAKQIEAGAPSDLFFSADQDWMKYLVQKQKVSAKHVHAVLSNDLVLITPKTSTVQFKAVPQFNFAQSFQGHLCRANGVRTCREICQTKLNEVRLAAKFNRSNSWNR